jgi:hypothetical protein
MTSVLQVRGAGFGSRCISDLFGLLITVSVVLFIGPGVLAPHRRWSHSAWTLCVPPTRRGRDALLGQISAALCSIRTGGPKVRDRFICQPEASSHRYAVIVRGC